MGEVVNLRLRRKRAARDAADAAADRNRISHGLPKSLRRTAEREAETQASRLEGHRLGRDSSGDDPDATGAHATPPTSETHPPSEAPSRSGDTPSADIGLPDGLR